MKTFIALAIILMAQTSFGASPKYVQLSASEINQSQLIQNLRDLGADYVIQQGVFISTKSPLPGSYYELTKTEKVERKITSSVTYYKYTVILTEYDNQAVVRATYTINFKPSTGGFLISSFNYKIIGGNPNGEQSVGGPSLVDVRALNNGTDEYLSPFLSESIDYVVADAIENGKLPESTYTLKYVYNAYLEDSGYPPRYVFLVRLVNEEGETYRVEITAAESDEGEDDYYGDDDFEEGEYENEYEFEGEDNGEGFHEENNIEYVIYPNA